MVKTALKKIMLSGQAPYYGFPYPYHLLSEDKKHLWQSYFEKGSGFIIFLLIFGIICFQFLFGSKKSQKIAKIIIVLTVFFWISKEAYVFHFTLHFTKIPSNILALPVIKQSALIFYLISVPLFLYLFTKTRQSLYLKIRPFLRHLTDLTIIILLFLLCLPFLI